MCGGIIVGRGVTTTCAVAVFPGPPSIEVTTLVVLVKVPVAPPVATTFTWNSHPPGFTSAKPSVAPVRVIVFDPGTAVIVPPPQENNRPFGVATAKPTGRVSVKPTPVSVPKTTGVPAGWRF